MAVPLFDLTRQYESLRPELEEAALRVLRSGQYVLGAEVEALERELAAYIGARHVVGLSSGTDALLAALMALGVGHGDSVVMPVYSFFATAGVVARLGATPLFVDIEQDYCNLDPRALQRTLDRAKNVKAAIFVHLYGAAHGIEPVAALLHERGIPLLEDTAQAIGTRSSGKHAGTFGLCGCFSTFPTKNLGGAGDGGFLSTDDAGFADAVRRLRNHGQAAAYRHVVVGGNFRLDALQAAVLRVKLRHLERFTAARRANAARYRQGLAGVRGLELPVDLPDRHTYHQFVVHVEPGRRDPALEHLRSQGIGCAVYYPIPFHRQPCFEALGYREGEFPLAERKSQSTLALPIFPELREQEQSEVIAALRAALA